MSRFIEIQTELTSDERDKCRAVNDFLVTNGVIAEQYDDLAKSMYRIVCQPKYRVYIETILYELNRSCEVNELHHVVVCRYVDGEKTKRIAMERFNKTETIVQLRLYEVLRSYWSSQRNMETISDEAVIEFGDLYEKLSTVDARVQNREQLKTVLKKFRKYQLIKWKGRTDKIGDETPIVILPSLSVIIGEKTLEEVYEILQSFNNRQNQETPETDEEEEAKE